MRAHKVNWVTPFLIVVFVLFLQASIPSVPSGTWQAWSTIGDVRSGAASVLLADGRILISGGENANGTTASVDLFANDATISAGPSMQAARSQHTATTLLDGRVLITGGVTNGSVINTAEIYDLEANSWMLLDATMVDARAGHTASLLPDGRVLLAGGHDSGGNALSSIELFDPANASFGLASGVMSVPRMNHAVAMLGDGSVLIIGGSDGTNALNSVDIFNPNTGTISQGPILSAPRISATATTTLDGKVAVIGGNDGSADLNSIETYDPATGQFTLSAATLANPRHGHQAFLLPNNNSILIVGGSLSGTDLSSAESFYPWVDSAQPVGAMAAARPGMTASPLSLDGLFLVAGGTGLSSTELYGFATVKTDQVDYAPGTVVTITGSGWQPGETVTLTLVESPLVDTHPLMTAVADANGNIFNNEFSPDIHDLDIRFFLTAVGSQSGNQAQNTFTDSISVNSVTVGPPSSVFVVPGGSANYSITVSFSGSGSACTANLTTTGLPAGATPSFSPSSVTSPATNSTLTIVTSASLTPNSYPFTINAAQGAGCGGGPTRTSAATLIVDNTPPDTSLTAQPSNPTNSTNASVSFVGTDNASAPANLTFECNLDAAGFNTCTSPKSYVGLSAASHNFQVRAKDQAGNVDPTPASFTWTIDTTPPAVPSTPDMTPGTDSGNSSTDDITNVQKPTFTGTEAENGTTITLLIDGVANGSTTTNAGAWTITATNNITDGTHSITATATDAAGNVSSPSAALSITIDTVANAPSTPDLDAASDSGNSNSDNLTNVTTPKFNGTAEANASVQLFRGGTTSLGTTTADGSGNWIFTLGSALADGTYSITAKQTDVAGNVSAASSALSVTIDTSGPNTPSSPNLSPSDDTGISNSDNITNKTTNLTFTGNADPSVTVELFEGAVSLGTTTSNAGSGNWNIVAAGPFVEGNHNFTAQAKDAAGNVSGVSAPHTVAIDITKPAVTINQAVGQADPAPVGPINFTVVFSEATTNFATGDVSLGGTAAPTTAVVTGSGTTYNVAVSGMTTAGTVIASIGAGVATDTAGNSNLASTSADNIVAYNPDNKPPIVTVTFPAPDGSNGWFKHSPVSGTVTANDTTTGNSNVTAFACTDGVNSLVVAGLTGIGTPSASGTMSVSAEGVHNVSCTATDSAGNNGAFAGSTAMPVLVKIDTVAPSGVAGATARVPDHNGWYNAAVGITFSGTDSTSGIASCTNSNYTGPDSATASVLGHCTDQAGNTSSDVAFDFKFDATAPTAVALSVTAGTLGANSWYTSDVTIRTSGTEDVSGPPVCTADQIQTVESTGQVFNGSCTNDAGLSASASSLTIKLDKTPPTAVLAVTAGTLGANGWYISDVTVSASGADNISNPVTCTADQFLSTDSTGHAFSGSCTNDAGLSTNAAALMVKLDKTPPTVAITPDRGADHNGWYNHGLGFTNPGSDATSGIASCTTPAAYSGPDNTLASVSASCTDNAGNVRNDSFSFQFDSTPPINIVGLPNRMADHNAWYNHALDVVFHGNDGTSGIEACSTINYAAPDSSSASVMGHCTDLAGNASADVASSTFKFDATTPTASLAVTAGTLGTNSWYITDVTVSTSGTDTISNPTICTADQFQTTETTGFVFDGSCMNDAGLSTNATPLAVKLDKTAPTAVTLEPSGTLGLNGWYISDVNIHTSGIENISSPIHCTTDQSQTNDTSGQVFHGSCTNDAGLSSSATDLTIKRDATPPTLALAFSPDSPDGLNNWWKTTGGVPYAWTCSDATSGVDSSYYGGCPGPLNGVVLTNGTTHFGAQVRDQAGNLSVQVSRDLKLDNVAPVIAWTPLGDSCSLPGNSGWCRATQNAAFTASDPTSGLANLAQASFTQSTGTNGSAVLISSGSVMDQAGNVNLGVNAGPYKIDSVAPTITINNPGSGSTYLLNASIPASYTCSDATSGVANCAGPTANGANFSTNPVGGRSFTVNAADVAGNPATPMTNNYSIVYSSGGLCLGSPGHAILQPINSDGSSVFKLGSTVPAKFRVCDANGVPIGSPGVVIGYGLVAASNSPSITVDEDVYSTTPDTAFRWDPTGSQWIFNQSTKNNPTLNKTGVIYYFAIRLDDGSWIYFQYGLK
jgi:Big-like domain-containing protein/galactose oxidase-like protein/Kelch motif protein